MNLTDDEQIVLRWQAGETSKEIAAALGGLWSGSSVESRVRQLRALGVPLVKRSTRRYDLDLLEADLDLKRLRRLAIKGK